MDTLILTQICDNSSFFLLWLWLWLYCMTLFGLAIFMSALYNRAKVGIMVGIGVWFIQTVIYDVCWFSKDNLSSNIQFFLAINPYLATSFAGDNILVLDAAGKDVNFSKLDFEYMGFKIHYQLFWCTITSILLTLSGIYLEIVLPKEYGSSKHPCFCCKRKKLVNSSLIKKEEEHIDYEYFEKVTDHTLHEQERNHEILIVNELEKQFPDGVRAVRGVNMKMYQGQIFALLGHNGAGKTTTLNMLVGMLTPTSGTATFLNKDFKTDMDEIRKDIGLCPQHDILYDNLTVLEHLEIFAKFRNMEQNEMKKQINDLIRHLEMDKFKHQQVHTLSGGQCRKVSVALAFIGNPKIIFLDEPSSGLDLHSKIILWDMLKQYKNNRIVILTTHEMDEADYLGDRIAIMSQGTLRTCGTSMFLKKKFGVGYTLNIYKPNENKQNNETIINHIKSIIQSAKHEPNIATDLSFKLPFEEQSQFQKLFESLEGKQEEFGISTFGIEVTTLEDVFLEVAK